MGAVTPYLDGVNVAVPVLEGSVTHTLNGKKSATIRMPAFLCNVTNTSRLRVEINGVLDFHGPLAHIDDEGDEDAIYTTLTFTDPAEILEFRPARDGAASGDPGDFSKPSFMQRNATGPQMLQEILTQSIISGTPADAEGPMGITLGSFATGGVNLSGAPVDWPMTIAEIMGLLTSTGEVDVVFTPINSGGNMARVDVYNGDFGTDRTASVQFKYAMGTASNCARARRTIDKTELMNKLWLYLGPRVKTSQDPAGDQHWRGNITGDSSFAGHPSAATVLALRTASRADFYERMEVRVLDADFVATAELYKAWWLREQGMRAYPKTLVHLTPHRGIPPAFGIGDLIFVQAGSAFRGGFAGVQRVFQYTYRWDNDGVIELGEPVGQAGAPAVITSADQAAF